MIAARLLMGVDEGRMRGSLERWEGQAGMRDQPRSRRVQRRGKQQRGQKMYRKEGRQLDCSLQTLNDIQLQGCSTTGVAEGKTQGEADVEARARAGFRWMKIEESKTEGRERDGLDKYQEAETLNWASARPTGCGALGACACLR